MTLNPSDQSITVGRRPERDERQALRPGDQVLGTLTPAAARPGRTASARPGAPNGGRRRPSPASRRSSSWRVTAPRPRSSSSPSSTAISSSSAPPRTSSTRRPRRSSPLADGRRHHPQEADHRLRRADPGARRGHPPAQAHARTGIDTVASATDPPDPGSATGAIGLGPAPVRFAGRARHRPSRDQPEPMTMADQIRVLIVDDIPETRDHLAKLLGFESDIEVVGRGRVRREALELAATMRPDVVLMDINMPDMDGITATEKLAARGPDRRRRDDVGPGRGGLPPPLHAGRRARVLRQAVQQRRADRVDPPGLLARAGKAEPATDARRRRAARGDSPTRRRRARRRGRRALQPEGRRRPHDHGGEPRRRRGAEPASGRPRGRVVPVRRRRRAAQPEPARTSRSRISRPNCRPARPSRSTRS